MSWRASPSYFLRKLEGYRRSRRAYIFSDIIPPQDFAGSSNTQNVGHLLGFRSRQFASGAGQPVVAATFLPVFGFLRPVNLLDQLSLKERLDRRVQSSRPKPQASTGLLFNLPHDGVAVKVATGERKQDLERGRW